MGLLRHPDKDVWQADSNIEPEMSEAEIKARKYEYTACGESQGLKWPGSKSNEKMKIRDIWEISCNW